MTEVFDETITIGPNDVEGFIELIFWIEDLQEKNPLEWKRQVLSMIRANTTLYPEGTP